MTLLEQVRLRPVRHWRPGPDVLRIATWATVLVCAMLKLPLLGNPTGPDEGGYLLIASQWHPGSSLYGNYWVDRPPLLIAIHQLAVLFGGTLALRIIGVVAMAATVLLTAALVRASVRPGARAGVGAIAPVMLAGIFMTTPLFDAMRVDGEMLAVPFVLAGVLACVRACNAATRGACLRWAMAAGAAAMCAAMVKQNAVDVFVFAAVIALTRVRLVGLRLPMWSGFVTGAIATLGAVLGLADLHGTSPAGLWDAVVKFRFDAARMIQGSASSANSHRLDTLLLAALASLLPVVIGVLAWQVRRPALGVATRTSGQTLDLRWPAVALIGWEVVAIVGGGSFWLHYLIVLVPGVVVLAVAAAQRPLPGRRVLAGVLAVATLSAGIATFGATRIRYDDSSDAAAISYLREHERPGDTVTMAYGHPNVIWDSGLSSPYRELWSLPVRVRDHHLSSFIGVLKSDAAPTWVVVPGDSLVQWGIDAPGADQALSSRYHRVEDAGRYVIWQRNGAR